MADGQAEDKLMRDPQIHPTPREEALLEFEDGLICALADCYGLHESTVEDIVRFGAEWHSLSAQIDIEFKVRKQQWESDREDDELEAALSRLAEYDEYRRLSPWL